MERDPTGSAGETQGRGAVTILKPPKAEHLEVVMTF